VENCTGFQWDEGNSEKSWRRHKATQAKCEQVFFNLPLVVSEDWEHSGEESRFYALGLTDAGRPLFVVYTLRGELIRVISARDMMRRERKRYNDASLKELEASPEV
jgi:hypothetical protein